MRIFFSECLLHMKRSRIYSSVVRKKKSKIQVQKGLQIKQTSFCIADLSNVDDTACFNRIFKLCQTHSFLHPSKLVRNDNGIDIESMLIRRQFNAFDIDSMSIPLSFLTE